MPTASDLIAAVPAFCRLLRSQRDDAEVRRERRTRRLEAVLRAAVSLPSYRRSFGGTPGPDELAALPLLSRSGVAELLGDVRASRPGTGSIPRVRTSGSSGEPIWLLFDPRHQRGRFAARARYLWENGWRPQHRSAWMIGILPGSPDGELTRSRGLGGARFFSHVEDFARQVEWLRALDPAHLYTLPSNLEAIVHLIEARGVRLRSLRTVFTSGEVVEEALRERVRRVLGVEIADGYGTTEAFLGWQCPAGSYHVNDEHVVVEIVDRAGRPAAPGTVGRVLFTTLENLVMPLVRYEIDDFAEAVEGPCACGRTLSRIGRIHGRAMNLFRMPGGALLSPWKLVEPLRDLPTVRRSQVIQHDLERFTVRFVSDVPPEARVTQRIREQLVGLVGPHARFAFERVDDIPRTGRGKFMSTICELAR